MKTLTLNWLGVVGVAWLPGLVSAQTAGNTAVLPQPTALSQQANQLLANPALLFSQLDVDSDGLLNLNEFARISALSTQSVVLPTATAVPNEMFVPKTGVVPITGPNGAYTPKTGVAPLPTRSNPLPSRPQP